jgi:hypothetical protein
VSDLPRPDLDLLDWTPERRAASLAAVFRHAVAFAQGAEKWYAERRRAKRWGGRTLRIGAIVLGAVAAILPVLAQIDANDAKAAAIPPAWATVALAGAATLVALDRFLGFTSGWMRFMAAELEITRLRHGFEYDWQERLVTLSPTPSEEEAIALIDRARQLVLAIDDAIAAETGTWVTEFRSQLESAQNAVEQQHREPARR